MRHEPRATLDVPIETVARVSGWLQAHRQRVDARPWQRAATGWTQAVLVPRWFIDKPDLHLLARDARVSQATAYRYLHEAIEVIAAHAPDLPEALAAGRQGGWGFVCLDGTLVETSRSSAKSAAGHDIWYSGKHHAHRGNVQVVTDPTGFPVWTCPVEPGSTHDITCAREHALPALYPPMLFDSPRIYIANSETPHTSASYIASSSCGSMSPMSSATGVIPRRLHNDVIFWR